MAVFLLLTGFAQSTTAASVADLTSALFQPSAWHFGNEIKLKYEPEHNFDLDREADGNASELKLEYKSWFYFKPNDHFHTFTLLKLYREYNKYGSQTDSDPLRLELEEAYLKGEDLPVLGGGLSIKLGRQYFGDDRQWLYDTDLDGLRLVYGRHDWSLELAAMRYENPHVFRQKYDYGIDNLLVYGKYDFGSLDVGVYALKQHYREEDNERPLFIGLQIMGEIADSLEYWLEPGLVRGHDGSVELRGWGFDAGLTYTFDLLFQPALTLDYAYGSGDSDYGDDVNHAYRQTGLQDNEEDFHGLADFDYFGVMLEPEISNLKIWTVGLSMQPIDHFSNTLIYHHYRQAIAQSYVRDTELGVYPNGRNPNLGNEFDWIMDYESANGLELEFQLGYFMPGPAYDNARGAATFSKIELKYKF